MGIDRLVKGVVGVQALLYTLSCLAQHFAPDGQSKMYFSHADLSDQDLTTLRPIWMAFSMNCFCMTIQLFVILMTGLPWRLSFFLAAWFGYVWLDMVVSVYFPAWNPQFENAGVDRGAMNFWVCVNALFTAAWLWFGIVYQKAQSGVSSPPIQQAPWSLARITCGLWFALQLITVYMNLFDTHATIEMYFKGHQLTGEQFYLITPLMRGCGNFALGNCVFMAYSLYVGFTHQLLYGFAVFGVLGFLLCVTSLTGINPAMIDAGADMGPLKAWAGIMAVFTGLFFVSATQVKATASADGGKVSLLYYPEDVEAADPQE